MTSKLSKHEEKISSKSRLVATVLCFFFGILGVHRFYTWKPFTGVLWLFTLGFCGIGVFVDFIRLLCGVFKDGNGDKIYNWNP